MCGNNYFNSAIAFYVDIQSVAKRGRTEISGNFHRNAAVYHGVKNIARIIRRYSNWIYIHRDSRWSGLSATQGHSCTDKWVFQWVGGKRDRGGKIRVVAKRGRSTRRTANGKERKRTGIFRSMLSDSGGCNSQLLLLTNFHCSAIAR